MCGRISCHGDCLTTSRLDIGSIPSPSFMSRFQRLARTSIARSFYFSIVAALRSEDDFVYTENIGDAIEKLVGSLKRCGCAATTFWQSASNENENNGTMSWSVSFVLLISSCFEDTVILESKQCSPFSHKHRSDKPQVLTKQSLIILSLYETNK